ncbi:MAG: site-specific DNA-methyltransferase [Pirellulaceae bacterium]
MDAHLNEIVLDDCVTGLGDLAAGSVNLVFADPPFNIGYDYDVYDDTVERDQYIEWSSKWMSAVHRVLQPNGTFWFAIGDDYAADLKLASQDVGFHCRSWVIWYYTFGVNCSKKFTRSHTHLFYFVKNAKDFVFRDDDLDNRVPSARELVYNDKRANPTGRLPDDTWIIRPADAVGELVSDDDGTWNPYGSVPPLDDNRTFTLRPQDLDQCFTRSEDTWYFPRVAGTFKERAGFHGCQMPEQLLGRIIRTCSNTGDVVLDPFAGSATTLAVAKKLGRQFIGFEVSKDYVCYGNDRLNSICVGDRLDGSPEPLKSAPKTSVKRGKRSTAEERAVQDVAAKEQRYSNFQRELTDVGIAEAFRRTHDGFSADRVVADPQLNQQFVEACERLDLVGNARSWNTTLFRLRKAGKLSHIQSWQRTTLSWDECDEYLFASEVAWQSMVNSQAASSLDEIFCDPNLASQFDDRARRLAPGHDSFKYRWGALMIRKEAKAARCRAEVLTVPRRFGEIRPIDELDIASLPAGSAGLYLLSESPTQKLYVGETLDLRRRLELIRQQSNAWLDVADASILIQFLPMDNLMAGKLAWQSCIAKKYAPRLNCFELRSAL